MKRGIAAALCLILLLFSTGCGQARTGKTEEGLQKQDLTELSAAALYARAAEKMGMVLSYELTTTLSGGAEDVTLNTRRIRTGYDRFSFSQTKNGTTEGVYFNGETAWIIGPEGNYTAPASTMSFQNFRTETGFPVMALEMEHFVRIERDGMKVTYGEADETARASFAALDDWTVTGVEGSAVISEDLLLESEEIRVSGTTSDGTERNYTLKTTLLSHDDKELIAASVSGNTPVMRVNDIRLASLLPGARRIFEQASRAALTFICEDEATGLEDSAAYAYSDGSFILQGQNFSLQENVREKMPGGEEKRLVRQMLLTDGAAETAEYDALTGEKLLFSGQTAATAAEKRDSLFPSLTALSEANLTEETRGYSVTFTLTEEESRRLAEVVRDRFPGLVGRAISAESFTASGSLGIRKSDGSFSSLSYDLTAVIRGVSATRRVSVTVEYGEAGLLSLEPPVLLEEGSH